MRIYTDASTRGSLSGIAYVVTDNFDREVYKKGIVVEQRDNNTAELLAILMALEDVRRGKGKNIMIFTDSWYAISAIKNRPIRKNEKEIVKQIHCHLSRINCSLVWVKGHYRDGSASSYFNKRADKLSKVVRRLYEKELRKQKKLLFQCVCSQKKKWRC